MESWKPDVLAGNAQFSSNLMKNSILKPIKDWVVFKSAVDCWMSVLKDLNITDVWNANKQFNGYR